MAVFEKVNVVREANVYFDGRVTSRTLVFPDGTRKTLGIMLPGEYTFGTESAEVMEILSGKLEVQLPGASQWKMVSGGEVFEVAAHARFNLKVIEVTDYCCSYVEAS
jgi:uncharacterized protein YaiE (UPF0345 family)